MSQGSRIQQQHWEAAKVMRDAMPSGWEREGVGPTLGAGDHHDTVGLSLLLGRHAHALRRIDLVHGRAHLLVRLNVRHLQTPQPAHRNSHLLYIKK